MSSHRDSSSVVDLNAPLLPRAEHRGSERSARAPRPHNTADNHNNDDDDDNHDQDLSGDLDLDLDHDIDVELTSDTNEPTGFQPPDRKEMATMIISGTVVLLLSVAAGLTTVFDWVL